MHAACGIVKIKVRTNAPEKHGPNHNLHYFFIFHHNNMSKDTIV